MHEYFFFQAEDGIRDVAVTGVQTCALPISLRTAFMATTKLSSREFNQDTSRAKRAAKRGPVFITDRGRPSHVLLTVEEYRSEERRVGKECRSRWSPYH